MDLEGSCFEENVVLKTEWSSTWNSAELERARPQHFSEGGCLDGVCELLLLVVPMAPSQDCDAPDKDAGLPGNQQIIPSPASRGEHRRRMVSLF